MSRRRLLVALALLVPLGLLTKASDLPLVRGHLGGAVYVVFWTYLALLLKPRWPPARVALGVLAATSAIELFQLVRWPERVRASFLGGALLGSEFDPLDFAAYAVGAAIAVLGSRYTGSTKVVEKSTPGASASTASSQ